MTSPGRQHVGDSSDGPGAPRQEVVAGSRRTRQIDGSSIDSHERAGEADAGASTIPDAVSAAPTRTERLASPVR